MSRWKYAFSLSKAEVKDTTPPGTVRLVDRSEAETSENGEIVKFPRPSADPADPLNWAPWRKLAMLLVVSVYAFVSNFISSSIAPALPLWAYTFPQDPRTYSELSRLVAVSILFLGAANIWWVPLSNWSGRRPVMLVATLLMTVFSIWCALATSYNSLLAARIFQAMGGAAADTVAPSLIGDAYFIHERGRAMSIYTLFLCTGSLVGGISGGYIGFGLGWAYIFWVAVALTGACFLGVLFLVPETLYIREEPTLSGNGSSQSLEDETKETQHVTHAELARPNNNNDNNIEHYRPYTFFRSLGFVRPRGSLIRQFAQPWIALALPGTWVVMLHYSGLVGGIVTISVMGAQMVSAPPYLWGANAGLINVGGLIGALLGGLYTYAVSDWQLRRDARKREGHGYAEPEARLVTMFPALFVATAGFLVFGFCAQNPAPGRWVGLEAGYVMITFGLMQVPSIGFNYIIDAYTYRAADCFVVVTILRSIVSFAWTFFVADWVETRGAAEAFGVFGMMMGLFSLLTVPLWLFGKRMRIATASLFEA